MLRIEYFFRRLELFPFLFLPSHCKNNNLVIVTGADSTHYKSLCQFLSSLFLHEPKIRAVVFDLGLRDSERQHLEKSFSSADLRRFDYTQYPNYFNIKINAGEYAWKPIILNNILNEFKCCVCWMDAGNLVVKPLFWIRKITETLGIYSPRSSGLISDWTHPKTLEFLNTSNRLHHKPNLSGNCVAINYYNPKARDLAERWKACALNKECIAPQGSSRKNHRQDQAVLSVIAYQSGITKGIPIRHYGFIGHQDID